MKPKTIQEIDAGNALAASIILADPEKYDGLPLIWAQMWTKRNGHLKIPEATGGPTIEERLAAHDRRKRKKQIQERRERWKLRKWKKTNKGNPVTRHRHYRIIVFEKDGKWNIAITDLVTNEVEFSRRGYKTCDEAKEAAFDALLYMESKRKNADPRLLYKTEEPALIAVAE